ncbi:MAG: hypothetical protein AM325_013430 [Candidatus Thorarchaeota archaeon SMTZ1-45]|nr:MAG: hypothetical protein AM325_14965 [Candidatus Thorarchaeota archaeon SMTZ1-45]
MKKLLVTLTPSESKRLIAKGLLALDLVQEALEIGYLCITLGTTSGYLVEEILGEYDKTRHIAGIIVPKGLSVTDRETRAFDAIFHRGEYLENKKVIDVLDKMGPDDVIIKSANALDENYLPIVLLASDTGGTVGSFIGTAAAKNIKVIVPVGLEKSIPVAYEEFCGQFGMDDWDYAIGTPVGAIALTEGIVFSEIEAIEVLFDAGAIPISAGGVNGAEGSISLFIEGDDDEIAQAYEFFKDLKGEPPFPKVDRVK